jgi:hypothetical protein
MFVDKFSIFLHLCEIKLILEKKRKYSRTLAVLAGTNEERLLLEETVVRNGTPVHYFDVLFCLGFLCVSVSLF